VQKVLASSASDANA